MSKKKYIQTSLSCPDAGLEVIEEKDDAMQTRVLCPFCGKETTVGETIMISGFVGCPACYWDEKDGLRVTVERVKEKCYGDYLAGNFYRNGYKNWRVKKG